MHTTSTTASSLASTAATQPTVGAVVACPDPACGQPAEVVDTWVWQSTAGPAPHMRTRCLARHVFTPPVDLRIPPVAHAPLGGADRVAADAGGAQ